MTSTAFLRAELSTNLSVYYYLIVPCLLYNNLTYY